MTYYKQIDSFRFFAAFIVLTAHWLHDSSIVSQLKLGNIGVDFFFVISGFLISSKLFELKDSTYSNPINIKTAIAIFYFKRILRIFPLYYVVLFFGTLFNHGEIREAFIHNLTYTTNFYFITTQHWPSNFGHFL